MHQELQWRLAQAFPQSTDAALIRGFTQGILLADGLLDSEPFLQGAIGRDLRGHLRRAGILFRLHELCMRGDLPFGATISKMPRGNWHWLELASGKYVAHLCRTDSPLAFPEDNPTRQDDRFRNQNDLFEPNVVPLAELADQAKGMTAWLTFGGGTAGQLQHLCWALPAADGGQWLAHIDVLRRVASSGVAEYPDTSQTRGLSLRFKEHIAESLATNPNYSGKKI